MRIKRLFFVDILSTGSGSVQAYSHTSKIAECSLSCFVFKMSFHFSAVLSGHSKDVRCLASIPDPVSAGADGGCIISGSRDCTVKLWHQDNATKPPVWGERLTFAGHKKYVSCVAAQLPNDKFPEVRNRKTCKSCRSVTRSLHPV